MSKKLKAKKTTTTKWVGVRAAAREIGISPCHLSNVLHHRRKATPALLEYLYKQGVECE